MAVPITVKAIATHRFAASPEQVFDAWLDPEQVPIWFGPGLGEMTQVSIDARVGGGFMLVQRRVDQDAAHAGEYVEIDRPRRLVFTWRVPPETTDSSRVIIDITPLIGGCEVSLTHEMEAAWAEYKERVEGSWQRMMTAMAEALR